MRDRMFLARFRAFTTSHWRFFAYLALGVSVLWLVTAVQEAAAGRPYVLSLLLAAGFAFGGVDDDRRRFERRAVGGHGAPLDPGREAGTAAPAHARGRDFFDCRVRPELARAV